MKQLKLGVKREGHRFDIKILPFYRFMSYTVISNDYELCVPFSDSKNKRPSVKYKNLIYSGAISSRGNWNIYLRGDNPTYLVNMKKYSIYVKGGIKPSKDRIVNSINSIPVRTIPSEYKKVYEECIAYNKKLYDLILDKKLLEEELLGFINDEYSIFLEENGSKTAFFEECSQYLENFILAEKECPKLAKIISVNDILEQKYESIEKLKIKNINEFIARAIDVIADEYKDGTSIYYSRELVYDEIVDEVLQNIEEQRLIQYEKNYSKSMQIKKLLGDKLLILNDIKPLLQRINYLINIGEISSEQMILEKADELIEECVFFEKLYNQFKDCNYIKTIDLSIEKEQLFINYEKGVVELSKDEHTEYNVYKVIMPYYYSCLYNKKMTKLKPSIEKINLYFEFAKNAIELLIKNNIIFKRGDIIEYRNGGNISQYIQDVENLIMRTEKE